MRKINVLILAAGLGERLLPITSYIPKPLIPVLGKPVMAYVLDRLSSLPLNYIGINLHYKKDAIEAWVSQNPLKEKIRLFPEKIMLGTGGALKNAEAFLKERTFLVHNSDIITDINLEQLLDFHLKSNNLATLCAHDYPEFNCLVTDTDGYLKSVSRSKSKSAEKGHMLAFTGIALYEPQFLDYLSKGHSNVVNAWLDAVNDGQTIGIYEAKGNRWSDIGTPGTYASLVFERLRDEGEMLYIHPSIDITTLDIKGYAVIEKECDIRTSVTLRNCILLPGCHIGNQGSAVHEIPIQKEHHAASLMENCIVGPDFQMKFSESEVAVLHGDNEKQLIGSGGSDRIYYRVRKENKTMVLMQCRPDDPDFERHLEYTRFFMNHTVPVPALIRSDPDRMEAYFEDGGDISLYTYLKCHREEKEIVSLYKKVIGALIPLHTEATENVPCCPLLAERIFDYDHFRWETGYFIEHFILNIKKMSVPDSPTLKKEFHTLADKAASLPKTIIHRDFQSRNIMVVDNHKILIIDYQGARMGPPAYDLASLFWDPYYRLDDRIREALLQYYIDLMLRQNRFSLPLNQSTETTEVRGILNINRGRDLIKEKVQEEFDEDTFRESLLICRLQRHMQALGAYGFLSSVKGKTYFLRHIPEGLRLLKEDITVMKDKYPALHQLIMSCR
jgi:NDP-sugar pyrophosphorylase family protein